MDKKHKLPEIAVAQLVSAAEQISKREKNKTAAEIFKQYLTLMDKYSDYFFSEPWPKKFDYKHVTTFTREDLDFIDENQDEYVESSGGNDEEEHIFSGVQYKRRNVLDRKCFY